MMTFAGHRVFPIKQKKMFSILANKTQSAFVLDNMAVTTIWMMVWMIEKSNRENYCCWMKRRHGCLDET